jgi:uroporphyrinogen decarboxylase
MIKYDENFFSCDTVLEYTKKRNPDFGNLLAVLLKESPKRPVLFEFFMNNTIYHMLTGIDLAAAAYDHSRKMNVLMHAYRNAVYDYVTTLSPFSFTLKTQKKGKTISQNETVMIYDRKSFDEYEWPKPELCDYSYMKKLDESMLAGMKSIPFSPGGVLENTTMLLGYENMCYLIHDDPLLVSDVFEKVGQILLDYYEHVLDYPCVGAAIVNDDWGYRTQTMLGTEDMRKFVIPWHKRIVERIHKAGVPAILHSCGQLEAVYDDIIDDIGFDAKHSYEDAIIPVEEFYDKYHCRLAVLGGIDLDYVCKRTREEIYIRSKKMLQKTASSGGYALGTGNSVPEYVPYENYFAMILAGLTD